MKYQYETCCVNSTYELITAMTDQAKEITYDTLRKYVDLKEFKESMGYARGILTLKNDWAVSYYRSVYNGKPCYYVKHSAIEYIWVKQ